MKLAKRKQSRRAAPARQRVKGVRGLIILILVSAALLAYTLIVGNRPFLGLDLQGGVSVVLKSKEQVDADALDQAKQIIEKRINALGVAEPEVSRQGENVLVQIAGVKDKDRALELVGQTAELRFRPVLGMGSPVDPNAEAPADQNQDGTTQTIVVNEDGSTSGDNTITVDGTPSTSTESSEGSGEGSVSVDGVDEQGMRSGRLHLGENAQAQPDTPTSTIISDSADSSTVPTTGPSPDTAEQPATGTPDATVPTADAGLTASPEQAALPADVCTAGVPVEMDKPDQQVVLPQCDLKTRELITVYSLGPTVMSGTALETARTGLDPNGGWVVNPVFRDGADGIGKFNEIAAKCFAKDPTCPTGQLAIVLDGNVISAPVIQVASFQRDQIQISGSFNERTAKDLATALKYGALPVAFEIQQAQVVSATLGHDALEAGLVAGLVGLILVAAYMIIWYRILGVLAVLKLAIEGALLWSVISYLGANNGLALTLAGVTGIIVSIGMSFDSNVVYYEHIKEDVRAGRSVRMSADKAFTSSFSTIMKADLASLIGAFLLWWLTVGPVRGFAFYLGMSTLLDLITSYFYMRPVVGWATRGDLAARHPRRFGLPDIGDGPHDQKIGKRGGQTGAAETQIDDKEDSVVGGGQ